MSNNSHFYVVLYHFQGAFISITPLVLMTRKTFQSPSLFDRWGKRGEVEWMSLGHRAGKENPDSSPGSVAPKTPVTSQSPLWTWLQGLGFLGTWVFCQWGCRRLLAGLRDGDQEVPAAQSGGTRLTLLAPMLGFSREEGRIPAPPSSFPHPAQPVSENREEGSTSLTFTSRQES